MFDGIKKIFNKSSKKTFKKAVTEINFSDLKLQNISIQVKPNGNATVLVIIENKSQTEIVIDKEQCLLLSIILREYYDSGEFGQISKLFKGEN